MVALPYTPYSEQMGQLRQSDAVGTVLSAMMRFSGAVMILSSVGIWVVPTIAGDGMIVLMKLLVSVLFACLGAVLLTWGQASVTDEIHMDTEARELTHIQRSLRGATRVCARYRFDELSDIRLIDGSLSVLGKCGTVVVQLPVETLENLDLIRGALQQDATRSA